MKCSSVPLQNGSFKWSTRFPLVHYDPRAQWSIAGQGHALPLEGGLEGICHQHFCLC